MNFVTLKTVTLHYEFRSAGAGKPVLVFANSLGTDFRIWDGVIGCLQGDYSILRYDKRGHGLSAAGTPPYHMDDHVGDLTRLLDHLEVTDVILCGLSVGGMIAQGVALTRPDLVGRLVLCDTGHKIGDRLLWQNRIDAVLKDGLKPMTDTVMERWFTSDFRQQDNPVYAGCRAMFERQEPAGYAGTCAAIRDADFTQTVRALSAPTLCLVGSEDTSTPPALVQKLAGLIPKASFVVIEGAGHLPCLEQIQAFTRTLEDFITGDRSWETNC
ncbi:MAG: 3-oxoadipate enol-lactonase [Sneathiella sp.]